MKRPFLQHLASAKDLETTYEAIRAGFVALALEKNRRATPFVAQARALKAAASHAKTPADLLRIEEIQSGLLTATRVSDNLTDDAQIASITIASFAQQRRFDAPGETKLPFNVNQGSCLLNQPSACIRRATRRRSPGDIFTESRHACILLGQSGAAGLD